MGAGARPGARPARGKIIGDRLKFMRDPFHQGGEFGFKDACFRRHYRHGALLSRWGAPRR